MRMPGVSAQSQSRVEVPLGLASRRIDGQLEVILEGTVTVEGTAADIRVQSSGFRELEEPCINSLKEWRFRPGEIDGEPAPYRLTFRCSTHVW